MATQCWKNYSFPFLFGMSLILSVRSLDNKVKNV